MTKTTRRYYALYAPYGVHVAYGEYHCPTIYIFDSAKARDAWVANDSELKRESCSARIARKYMPSTRWEYDMSVVDCTVQ